MSLEGSCDLRALAGPDPDPGPHPSSHVAAPDSSANLWEGTHVKAGSSEVELQGHGFPRQNLTFC